MKLLKLVLLVACVAASIPAGAQNQTPALNFDAANALTLPDDIYLGEVGGVATSSKGDVYVYTRTGAPLRLCRWPRRARSRTADRGCSNSIATGASRARSARGSTASCLPRKFAFIPRTPSGSSMRWRRGS